MCKEKNHSVSEFITITIGLDSIFNSLNNYSPQSLPKSIQIEQSTQANPRPMQIGLMRISQKRDHGGRNMIYTSFVEEQITAMQLVLRRSRESLKKTNRVSQNSLSCPSSLVYGYCSFSISVFCCTLSCQCDSFMLCRSRAPMYYSAAEATRQRLEFPPYSTSYPPDS